MTLISYCLKKGEFAWSIIISKAFVEIKKRIVRASIMHVLIFFQSFLVTCDASGFGIDRVLAQEGHPVTYFYEKLNDDKQ